jgi:hypothetical protein
MSVSFTVVSFPVTNRLAACYAGVSAVSPWHKIWLVIAGCHLARAVHIRVHFAAHHQPFRTASPLIIASLCVVKHDGCESRGRPSNSSDHDAKHPKATCALLAINVSPSCWHRDTYDIVLRVHVRFAQRTPSDKSHHGGRQIQAPGDDGGICRRLFEIDDRVVCLILL